MLTFSFIKDSIAQRMASFLWRSEKIEKREMIYCCIDVLMCVVKIEHVY